MEVKFKAAEYTADDSFKIADYEFKGDEDSGWQILRNNRNHLRLEKGYRLLKTRLCGICSTDLARKFLPYPLPQITGHEIVAQDLKSTKKFVVEINDTPYYREDKPLDVFSKSGLFTHTPKRMVLGIDRLPGGFGPYILAPKKSIVPIGDLNEHSAVLTEPFAAALQAIFASPPKSGYCVAVLGPRRLGSLVIAALKAHRQSTGKNFKIYAIAKYDKLLDMCLQLGADEKVNLADADSSETAPYTTAPSETAPRSLHAMFDIVYDTTGTASGFELALKLAKREVHLKSTNGQSVCGLDNLTPFVVDELSLLPYNHDNIEFTWANEKRKNRNIYKAPCVKDIKKADKNLYTGDSKTANDILHSYDFENFLPRFDIAVASTLNEIDKIIRPNPDNENSLVRPRGAILFKGDPGDNQILQFIAKGGKIRSSRCGDFHTAIELLKKNKALSSDLPRLMISHIFPVHELKRAFELAKTKSALKVIVKHT